MEENFIIEEKFDLNAYATARKHLLFNSKAQITNLNNKSYTKGEDRYPTDKRLIDMSEATIKALAFKQDGILRVVVELEDAG